ncbi:MAG: tetratricopeptide repeat protein [Verrucomicrobiaceae bacterium]|nr:tetratricopeptide repeat protein [Verrucomicrobiaceae bacterium]
MSLRASPSPTFPPMSLIAIPLLHPAARPHRARVMVAAALLALGLAPDTRAQAPAAPVPPTPAVPTPATPLPPTQATPVPEDILSYADLLYSKDQFALAAQQYQIFIREQPDSPNLQAAWFRLGECYLEVDQLEDAVTTFNYLINTYRRGVFVGSAAYRLAVLRFNSKDYRNALAYFKVAKDELTNPEAVVQARFYHARCLQLTNQPKEALAELEAVMAAGKPEENPFYERCLLESARLFFELGDAAKSLERFQQLAEKASTPEFKEEAIVRGGLMAAEAGQSDLSEKLLNQALDFPDTSPWKSLARVGAIFNAFSRGDHDKVIGLYSTGTYDTPDESRAKLLLIVGHSFRIKNDLESALRLYSLVEGKYPDRTEGIEAGYRKLQILHQEGDPLLPEFATRFAERQSKTNPDSTFIDMAHLMVAEWHFNQAENSASGPGSDFAIKHYAEAAAAYRLVREENIDEKYHEARLYKQGWAEIESGQDSEGILTLSRFIQLHHDSALASSALAKRALAYQAQEDHQYALGDYLDIAKRHPDSPELEFALQQIALIYAHQRKIPEMIEAYRNLLAKFPDTKGAGEAHYWIGVGHFDLEEYTEALAELKKARELDPANEDKATLRIVIAHYQLENIPELAAEARRYLENTPGETAADEKETDKDEKASPAKRTTIPPQILEYVGRKLAEDGKYEDAEYFLTSITDPEKPDETTASVWKLLAECRARLKKFHETIAAYDHYLGLTERPSDRAAAYLARGAAQLCLRDFEADRDSARDSLRSQKEGRTNAEARILLGDISAADGKLEEAAKEYLVVSQIFTDPEITPKALAKAIKAYRALGDQARAEELTQELSKNYPNYVAPEKSDEC